MGIIWNAGTQELPSEGAFFLFSWIPNSLLTLSEFLSFGASSLLKDSPGWE